MQSSSMSREARLNSPSWRSTSSISLCISRIASNRESYTDLSEEASPMEASPEKFRML